jgi:hypothetical protein
MNQKLIFPVAINMYLRYQISLKYIQYFQRYDMKRDKTSLYAFILGMLNKDYIIFSCVAEGPDLTEQSA